MVPLRPINSRPFRIADAAFPLSLRGEEDEKEKEEGVKERRSEMSK
jgi:hypothetical protein